MKFGELRINSTSRFYLNRAVESNWVSEGPNVREFEARFAQKFGSQKFGYPHAIATSSGTDACTIACAALRGEGYMGGEIIVPACTFAATASAVLAAGILPRFVDVELHTLNMDPSLIEAAIMARAMPTRAIFAVHLMGRPAPMEEICQIADIYHLRVIEDVCEAIGAIYRGRYTGNWGDMGCFSFYAAHTIVCGEGGMVVTKDPRLAETLRSLRYHGRPPGSNYFDFQRVGFNAKMNDMEAAIGLGELEVLYHTRESRRHNMAQLLEMLKGLEDRCILPRESPGETISPHAFWLVDRRDQPQYGHPALYRYLTERGIECKTLFGSLPTQHRAFAFLGHKMGDFPVAEYIGRNGIQFGIHQYLTQEHLEYIAETLREFFLG